MPVGNIRLKPMLDWSSISCVTSCKGGEGILRERDRGSFACAITHNISPKKKPVIPDFIPDKKNIITVLLVTITGYLLVTSLAKCSF